MNHDWKRFLSRIGLVLMLDGLLCMILTTVPEGYAVERLVSVIFLSIGGALYIGLGE